MSEAVQLISRSAESKAIEGFVDSLALGSRWMLIDGEVGIGKTTVLEWTRQVAAERGCLVLDASPVPSEAPLEFAAVADLLAPVDLVSFPDLPEPQRRALAFAVLRQETPGVSVDPRTLGVAMLRVLRQLATDAPVLLAIDDLPWLDRPSRQVLTYVLRRIGEPLSG